MIKPHGSETLNPLFVYDPVRHRELLQEAEGLPSLLLNSAAAANAVMLGTGYFNPLTGYMSAADALSVAERMRTTDGLFWPVPVLNLTRDLASVKGARRIALRDPNLAGHPVLAVMDVQDVEELAEPELDFIVEKVFRTLDPAHAGVATFRSLGR